MVSTILQMALIISCGAVWRIFSPRGLDAQQTRLVVTSVVYYLLLPALIIDVLWHADIGIKSLQYTLLGILSIVVTLCISLLCGKILKLSAPQMGAFLLATAFPNVTFLGLPVLEQLFGHWARSVVIQIDLFAVAPFLFTAGIALSRHYGVDEQSPPRGSVFAFLNAPPFWGVFIAVTLNLNAIECPELLGNVLQRLSAAVIPLMLFSMGLALSWRTIQAKQLPIAIAVLSLKLLFMPWFAFNLVHLMDFAPQYKAAAALDIAMPSMLMGVVFCDRYQLDSTLYAMLVTVTTAASMISLPLWYQYLAPQLL